MTTSRRRPLHLRSVAVCGVFCLGLLGCSRSNTVPSPPQIDIAALRDQAEAGVAVAQARYGRALAEGQGAARDYAQAVRWYHAAIAQGNADAQAGLGELYEVGQGVARDPAEAVRLYREAADHGSAVGQYNLAFLYEQGKFLKVDQVQASKYYRLAAEGGNPLAQFDLGQRYELGVGVPRDRVEALVWFNLAAAQGQADAVGKLSEAKAQLSGSEIKEAERRTAAFQPRK